MHALISTKLLTDIQAQRRSRPFEIYDTRLSGFTLRVQPSGVRSYYARFGRNRRFALGKVDVVAPDEARAKCHQILGNIAHGRNPLDGLSGVAGITLGQFIDDIYTPWVHANRPRTADNTLEKLRLLFGSWFAEPLSAITVERLELWKGRRLNKGLKGTTVTRDLYAISSVLTRAVRVGKLTTNPIRKVEKPHIDRRPKVRFLDGDEEARLRRILHERDQAIRTARETMNIRRRARGEDLLPALPHFGDHLTPAVLLSMNTGLRLCETRKLRWSSVDLARRWLTVEGGHAKSRQTRHIPLNQEACRVLTQWREQTGVGSQVFEIATSFKTAWGHVLERAGVSRFRWHDLRHHFASRLVQTGVPLNTVRDLLGHASVAMSLRYAHLAPDQRCAAVAKLDEKPIFALTVRLPWNGALGVAPASH
jgi:integrase